MHGHRADGSKMMCYWCQKEWSTFWQRLRSDVKLFFIAPPFHDWCSEGWQARAYQLDAAQRRMRAIDRAVMRGGGGASSAPRHHASQLLLEGELSDTSE